MHSTTRRATRDATSSTKMVKNNPNKDKKMGGATTRAATHNTAAKAKADGLVTLLALVATLLAAHDSRSQDTSLSPFDHFTADQEALNTLVIATKTYTGRENMRFTPINLFVGATWCATGLVGSFNLIFGHFETHSLNLHGKLLKPHVTNKEKKGQPVSAVWNLLYMYLGDVLKTKCVLCNVVPFTGDHKEGTKIWKDIPKEVQNLMDKLIISALNAMGAPIALTCFGVKVRVAGSEF